MSTPTGTDVADALAAEGAEVTLTDLDGRPVNVKIRFTLGSLRELEREFGSIKRLQKVFEEIMGALDDDTGAGGRGAFDSLVIFLAAGLRHVRWAHPETGETIRLGQDRDVVAEVLELRYMRDYITAFSQAFAQAMGPTTRPAPPVAGPGSPLALSTPGPGASGGTSPSTLGTFGQPSSGT